MKIDSYSFGAIVVNGKEYDKDIIILGDKIISNWRRMEGHTLLSQDIQDIAEYKPDVLVVGTGEDNCMDVAQETKEYISKCGIELKEAGTHKAWKIFNEEISKNIKIAGAFHLTC